jgi:serine O-acetyltransferase
MTKEKKSLPLQDLGNTVEALVQSATEYKGFLRKSSIVELPSLEKIDEVIEGLKAIFFPGFFGESDITPRKLKYHIGYNLDKILETLEEQVRLGFCFIGEEGLEGCEKFDRQVAEVINQFVEELPGLKELLILDVKAAYEGDPAAISPGEVIFCYPGFRAILHHRIAHILYNLGVPVIPRIIAEASHATTGIDIHPGAKIGREFFIDHGNAVVIGETAVVGDRVRIYQGVTLGAKSFPLDEDGHPIKGVPRHPCVEEDVVIYSGATILGRITIGKGSVIGGNVWLTHSVAPGSQVSQAGIKKTSMSGGEGI